MVGSFLLQMGRKIPLGSSHSYPGLGLHRITPGKADNGAFGAGSLNSPCFQLRDFLCLFFFFFFWGKNVRKWFTFISLIRCHSNVIRHNGGKQLKNLIPKICVSSTRTIFKDYNEVFSLCKKKYKDSRAKPLFVGTFFSLWVGQN